MSTQIVLVVKCWAHSAQERPKEQSKAAEVRAVERDWISRC